jgi:hypothetical protein
MNITADIHTGKLIVQGAVFSISNRIRTVRDGTRKAYDVVRTIPGDYPYDPQPFPRGAWRVTAVEWQKEKGFDPRTYGPVKIRTDAWQWVNVWELDNDGDYLRETEKRVKDTAYLFHYTAFNTTLGCIRLYSPGDAIVIANIIARALDREKVLVEVI